MQEMNMKKILLAGLLSCLFILSALGCSSSENNVKKKSLVSEQDQKHLIHTIKKQKSDTQVRGQGVVIKRLPDDTKGHQHQRFLLKLKSGQVILIAHNIDLAPKITSLRKGDVVAFYGEFEWNQKGGVVHWTHHDPRGKHTGGWLMHKGVKYK
jgi:hypothetical protein